MKKQNIATQLAKRAAGKLRILLPSERQKRRLHAEMETRISRDSAYFASIKNKFAGQRGFVIGNGPSLKIKDLDRLQGEICIASNKIYLAFGETDWRPSFYTIVDSLVWEKIRAVVGDHVGTVIVPDYLPHYPACSADVKTFRIIANAPDMSPHADKLLFSDDFTTGSYGGYTVTYENIQLAVHLGLDPIYIIGCDHHYEGEKDIVKNQTISAPSTSNHFVKNYRQPGEIVNVALIEKMNKSYSIAHDFATSQGITLMNATRGGFLEAFPRIDFDKITTTAVSREADDQRT